jgi:hypothetical protein
MYVPSGCLTVFSLSTYCSAALALLQIVQILCGTTAFTSGERVEEDSSLRVEGSDLRIDDMNAEIADLIKHSFMRWLHDTECGQSPDAYAADISKRRLGHSKH